MDATFFESRLVSYRRMESSIRPVPLLSLEFFRIKAGESFLKQTTLHNPFWMDVGSTQINFRMYSSMKIERGESQGSCRTFLGLPVLWDRYVVVC